jgi:aminopeptidase-like protein
VNTDLPEGEFMHELAHEVWEFPRSITGNGLRDTLKAFTRFLPGLEIHEVPSGTEVLDWVVPEEWNIAGAYLVGPSGERVIDYANSNVHVVSYSEPVDCELDLESLQSHLHSDPDHRQAIPYVTSYYNRTWGFCLTQEQRDSLVPGTYRAVIDATLEPGSLTYGEWVLHGESDSEVFISTYVCHPSLANNELSGPVVAVALARWLLTLPSRKYTYRFVFVPETIGPITYLSRNLDDLRSRVIAGFNLTCIGDEGDYSYLASRDGNTPIDRIAQRVVAKTSQPVVYSFMDRGSDERQYCAPGIDLPLISLMRTRYGHFEEYHTSADNLDFVTPAGLQGGFDLVRDCIAELEASEYLSTPVKGEPQLGKRGLYHTIHARTVSDEVLLRTHILAYSDGSHSEQDIATLTGRPVAEIEILTTELEDHGLITRSTLGNSKLGHARSGKRN